MTEFRSSQETHSTYSSKLKNAFGLPEFLLEETGHCKTFQRSFNLIQMFGKPVGFALAYDWKPARQFWFVLCLLMFTWSQFWCTQYIHISNKEYMRAIEVFALYGIALSVVIKFLTYLKNVKKLTALFNFILKICRKNVTGCRADSLKIRFNQNFTFYKWFIYIVTQSPAVFFVYPIAAFIVDGQLVTLIPIEIIFIDQSKPSGFLIANFIMSVMGITAYIFAVYFDLIFLAIILNYAVTVDGIQEDFKALDDFWSGKSKTTVEYRYWFLKNICIKRQDMHDYVSTVRQIYDWNIFMYFVATYICQIICLFEIVANRWIPGFGIAYGMVLEMGFYCLIGTKLTTENERLCWILQQSNWYKYDYQSQKLYLTLLQSCMNAQELSIGTLAQLNVFTGTEIFKSMYTYFTILMEMM